MLKSKREKNSEIDRKDRISMIERHTAGESYRKIAEELDVSKSAAHKIVTSWQEDHKIDPAPRSGAPRKLSLSDERYLKITSMRDPYATLHDITSSLDLDVSERTVGDSLQRQNL
ncbi:unnamed protein product [Tuber aestivum]|uniref:Transposase IS30-like HTH domain-containing protein n=1 Tax=Tuber aestivum TaxID=59557 RepID=A0A292PJ14_9PEZI|nr:unnamed protein product [Tuber aestivum]